MKGPAQYLRIRWVRKGVANRATQATVQSMKDFKPKVDCRLVHT